MVFVAFVVQLSSHFQLFATHGLQHTWPPCPSPSAEVCPSSCPLLQWCHPAISSSDTLLLLPSIFPSLRDFSNELAVRIRWPKYWSFNFSISPSNEYSGLISLKIDWFDLAVQGTLRSLLQHTVQRHQFFGTLPSLWSSSQNRTWSQQTPQPWLYGLLSAE